MARLVYLDNTGHEQSATIDQATPEVTVGRHPGRTIHTPNATVSRFHCTVKMTREGGYEIVDEGSSSGTFLNSYRIERQLLRHGDEICCGRFPLMFYEDHIQDIPWPDALWGGPTGWLLFTDDAGGERSLRIGKGSPRINIGRQNDCTIQTSDHSVSRVHSEVVFENGLFDVIDLNSANGTRVNNSPQRVTRQTLRTGDEVRLGQGRVAMHFYEDPGVPVVQDPARSVYDTHAPSFPVSNQDWAQNNPGNRQGAQKRGQDPLPTFMGDMPVVQTGQTPIATVPSINPIEKSGRTKELEDENSDLRRQLEGLRSRNDTLRRELEEAAVSRPRERTETEAERELSQRQIVIDNLEQRCRKFESQAREFETELMELRTELRKKRDESEEMRYKLSVHERDQNKDDAQVGSLLDENAALKAQAETFKRDFEEADRKANLLEYELKALKGDSDHEPLTVDDGANARGPSGVFSQTDTRVLQATENLNDSVSEFRNDLRNLRDYIDMIKTVYDAFKSIEVQYLTSSERNRIEEAIKEVAPDMVFEDINMTIEELLKAVTKVKDELSTLRKAVG